MSGRHADNENGMCKCPVVGGNLVCLRNQEKANVRGPWRLWKELALITQSNGKPSRGTRGVG